MTPGNKPTHSISVIDLPDAGIEKKIAKGVRARYVPMVTFAMLGALTVGVTVAILLFNRSVEFNGENSSPAQQESTTQL